MSAVQRLDDPAYLSAFLSMIGATPITTSTPPRVTGQDIENPAKEGENATADDQVSEKSDHVDIYPI